MSLSFPPPAAFLTMAVVLLHTFWGVIFFDACERRRYWCLGVVVASHLATSGLVSWMRRGLFPGIKRPSASSYAPLGTGRGPREHPAAFPAP